MGRTPRPFVATGAVAVWVLLVVAPLSAIGPSILMFYGGNLAEPILVYPGNPSITPTEYIWNPRNGGVRHGTTTRGSLPPNLEGRRYVSVAIFWGAFADPGALKPSDASQHGRIYLPTESEPAVVLVTAPRMTNPNSPTATPEGVPVPTDLAEFIAGWALTPGQTALLRRLAAVF